MPCVAVLKPCARSQLSTEQLTVGEAIVPQIKNCQVDTSGGANTARDFIVSHVEHDDARKWR